MEGMGEEKIYILLLKSVKHKEAQVRAKCLNSSLFEMSCVMVPILVDTNPYS